MSKSPTSPFKHALWRSPNIRVPRTPFTDNLLLRRKAKLIRRDIPHQGVINPKAAEDVQQVPSQEQCDDVLEEEVEIEEFFTVQERLASMSLGYSVGVEAAQLAPLSCAPGGGLPLWCPSAFAVVLAVIVAVRQSSGRDQLAGGLAVRGGRVSGGSVDLATRYRTEMQAAAKAAQLQETPEETAARLEKEAKKKAKEEAERQARREAQRIQAEKDAAELAAKKEAERKAKQKEEEAQAAELARRKALAEEAQQKRTEMRERESARRKKEKEEAAAKAKAEAKAAREAAEKERREQLGKQFILRVQGAASATVLPAGVDGSGGMPGIQLDVEARASTALDAPPAKASAELNGKMEAVERALPLSSTVAAGVGVAHASAIRMRHLLGGGPLNTMDDPELEHWKRVAAMRDRCNKQGGDQLEAVAGLADQMIERAASQQEADGWKSFFLDKQSSRVARDMVELTQQILGEEHLCVTLLTKHIRLKENEEEAVEKVEEEEWPDEQKVKQMRMRKDMEQTAIPEQVWALRNSAMSLAMTGVEEKALEMLEQALRLQEDWLGSPSNPGLLGELHAMYEVLGKRQEWAERKAEVGVRMLDIVSDVANQYQRDGKAAAAVWLLRGILLELAPIPTEGAACAAALSDEADKLTSELSSEEQDALKQRLVASQGGVIQDLVTQFGDELQRLYTPNSRVLKAYKTKDYEYDSDGEASTQAEIGNGQLEWTSEALAEEEALNAEEAALAQEEEELALAAEEAALAREEAELNRAQAAAQQQQTQSTPSQKEDDGQKKAAVITPDPLNSGESEGEAEVELGMAEVALSSSEEDAVGESEEDAVSESEEDSLAGTAGTDAEEGDTSGGDMITSVNDPSISLSANKGGVNELELPDTAVSEQEEQADVANEAGEDTETAKERPNSEVPKHPQDALDKASADRSEYQKASKAAVLSDPATLAAGAGEENARDVPGVKADASASRTRSNNAKVQSTGLFGWLARMGSGLHSVVEDNAAESGAGQETSGAGPGSATEGAGPGSTIDALTKQNTAEAARSNAPATKPAPVSKDSSKLASKGAQLQAAQGRPVDTLARRMGGGRPPLRPKLQRRGASPPVSPPPAWDSAFSLEETDVPTEPEVPPEERMLEVRNAAMLSKNKAKAQLMNRDASLRRKGPRNKLRGDWAVGGHEDGDLRH
ncbi:hypothetical protein CYMTET_15314 [Cymbomonas tetramitiformis]|uniref:Uncharacterized protein n=1 Tax=Cymbomonas tetramitiformis TaxID=36881 RepID=A0AAE0GEL8_9CHLO|nr:hypothetical protein CYMTET_15314 [Cymbomonas tetramitiformis]